MNSRSAQFKLVIFRIGSIGDTIVSLPCFHAIARTFPAHRRILLTNTVDSTRQSSAESVLESTGLVHETLYFPTGVAKLNHSMVLARRLRRLSPQALVYLTPRTSALQVYRDLLFFRAAGIRKVIGAPLGAGARSCRVDRATGELEYEAERLARALRPGIAVDLQMSSWDLRLTPPERATAVDRLKSLPEWQPVLAVAPGARVAAKDWGEERWKALLAVLQHRVPGVSLVFVGAPDERALADRLARHWNGAKLNLCGELTPRESASVLGRCHILVCHDSGPMHLAASQGTRCIALFGNFNLPREWFPYGPGHVVIHEAAGVQMISVDRVAEAVETAVQSIQTAPDSELQHANVTV